MAETDHELRDLLRKAGEAITTFRMIADGDRVLVGLSGGKDSAALLYVLRHLHGQAIDLVEQQALVALSPDLEGSVDDPPLEQALVVRPIPAVAVPAQLL